MTIVPFLYKVNNLILNPLILLVFALAFLYFIYGIVMFLKTDPGDKGQTRIEARNSILWGIVGMVIMFSVYGIIRFILATFGIAPSEIEGEAGNILDLRG
ncbi:MAG: hypothetical protein V4690_04290 [Patescibacteria group bacterium]